MMKTQLLEDIGESAALAAPATPAARPAAGKAAQSLASGGIALPAGTRTAGGVWRQKPAGEPPAPAPEQPEQAPLPELDKVFEELAALEAQLVQPDQQHAPATAPAAQEAPPAASAGSRHRPGAAPAQAPLARAPTLRASAPQDPLFDFTPPAPAARPAAPFTPAATGFTPARKRSALWAGCALTAALLIWGGRWAYQERNAVGPSVLVATGAQSAPAVDPAPTRRSVGASQPAPGADAAVPPAIPASDPVPAAPPLRMLEPAAAANPGPEPAAPSVANAREAPATPETRQSAQQGTASPIPTPSSRPRRGASETATAPAKERRERESARQLARASAGAPERPSGQDTSLSATLRACRERGYHATECVKRQCSVSKYGFACRGR